MASKIASGLKFLNQFGLRPLVLYGLYKLGLMTGHYKRLGNRKLEGSPLRTSPLFPSPDREQFIQILGEEGKASLLKEAEEILNGKFRMFGGEAVPLNLTFDQALHHWTAYEINPELLAPHYSPVSDIKFLWEPARFGWAFALGRVYHLTRDDRYAEAFWKYFEMFDESNPPNMGPHWMNGQEVALRMLSLVWAAHVFEDAPASSAERNGKLLHSIYVHAARIPVTLAYARSQNNNHLITEAAAIYTAGLYFDRRTWRTLGWRWFNWAIRNQIGGYGEYIQHSTNYHRLMLQAALWVNFIKQDVFPALTSQALARSVHWLFSILDGASGRTPNLGSNDGALIFPLSVCAFDDYRPTVQAAARAFLRTSLHSGVWDEMSLWFGLKPIERISDPSAYLSDNLRARDSWGYLRASNFKSRLSHMDQLHFDLWWRGLNIAQDAGTYLYNAESPWDNALMTARVHNTVMIDGREQMTRGGRFVVLDWASAYAKPVIEFDEKALHKIKAYYTGYRKFGLSHERTVTVYQDEFWRVEDRLVNSRRRPHGYRLHWLLPDWEWKVEENPTGALLKIKSPHGWISLNVKCSLDHDHLASIVRAGALMYGRRDVKPYEGWVSRIYGEKFPALSFAFEVTSPYHTAFTSEFTFPG